MLRYECRARDRGGREKGGRREGEGGGVCVGGAKLLLRTASFTGNFNCCDVPMEMRSRDSENLAN